MCEIVSTKLRGEIGAKSQTTSGMVQRSSTLEILFSDFEAQEGLRINNLKLELFAYIVKTWREDNSAHYHVSLNGNFSADLTSKFQDGKRMKDSSIMVFHVEESPDDAERYEMIVEVSGVLDEASRTNQLCLLEERTNGLSLFTDPWRIHGTSEQKQPRLENSETFLWKYRPPSISMSLYPSIDYISKVVEAFFEKASCYLGQPNVFCRDIDASTITKALTPLIRQISQLCADFEDIPLDSKHLSRPLKVKLTSKAFEIALPDMHTVDGMVINFCLGIYLEAFQTSFDIENLKHLELYGRFYGNVQRKDFHIKHWEYNLAPVHLVDKELFLVEDIPSGVGQFFKEGSKIMLQPKLFEAIGNILDLTKALQPVLCQMQNWCEIKIPSSIDQTQDNRYSSSEFYDSDLINIERKKKKLTLKQRNFNLMKRQLIQDINDLFKDLALFFEIDFKDSAVNRLKQTNLQNQKDTSQKVKSHESNLSVDDLVAANEMNRRDKNFMQHPAKQMTDILENGSTSDDCNLKDISQEETLSSCEKSTE